jgi:hypothetical protein
MQVFHRLAVIAGAMLLAGCATDGSTFLTSADPAAPAASEEAEAPPPAATTPPAARSTPARSTAAKPPHQTEKEKKAAKKQEAKPEKKPAPAAAEASAPAAAPKGKFNGSWQFSNGQKACMMTLSGSGSGGAVSASGDCWAGYTKAKSWKLQGNDMVLTDSANQPIARMQSTGETRYDGYGTDGEPVVLVR